MAHGTMLLACNYLHAASLRAQAIKICHRLSILFHRELASKQRIPTEFMRVLQHSAVRGLL